MNNKDFEEYLSKISKYTEEVLNKKVSSTESLQSLIKAGICNKEKILNSVYKLV